MHITIVEPYFSGSHKQWAQGLKEHSQHEISLLTLAGRHWKWRMHGGAISLAEKFNLSESTTDIFVCTDMLDVSVFRALLSPQFRDIPIVTYFHENQITYPWSSQDRDVKKNRNHHYGFINYTSALTSDHVLFNSDYHRQSFTGALPKFLKQYPDHQNLSSIKTIESKAKTLHLGLDLKKFDDLKTETSPSGKRALLLWNHRWEYDKGPEDFFSALFELQERGIDFQLAVLGESFEKSPDIFQTAKEILKEKIVHFGYCDDFKSYASFLCQADILPVTSNQDFFGISVIEAMYCNVKPLLPKRLAYPEHIPELYSSSFFYDQHEDFTNQLQRMIWNVSVLRKQKTDHIIDHYDWRKMIPKYDQFFSKLGK